MLEEWPEFPAVLNTLVKEHGCNVDRDDSIPTPDVLNV